MADGIWGWTIYDHPADYPDNVVVRGWRVENGLAVAFEDVVIVDTIDEARAAIPAGLRPIPRVASDDPVIVESWI